MKMKSMLSVWFVFSLLLLPARAFAEEHSTAASAGFLVQAEGIGVGYPWYHDGILVMPQGVPAGTRNESASAALRLSAVTMEDAGEYYADAIHAVGMVRSAAVTLTVLPVEAK